MGNCTKYVKADSGGIANLPWRNLEGEHPIDASGVLPGGESFGQSSGGNTDRQIMLLKDFGATVICCTPSYFLHLIERVGKMG